MTYIQKKHHLGYVNSVYSYRNPDDSYSTFKYALMFECLGLKNLSSVNYRLETHAFQLVFSRRDVVFPVIGPQNYNAHITEIRPYFKNWLDKNTDGWGHKPETAIYQQGSEQEILFNRRKDLLKFIDLIYFNLVQNKD
jgi:hypothetical protein